MFEVKVASRFQASHAIRLPDGEMEPHHEHTWGVELLFAGTELDGNGVLVDFVAIQERLDEVLGPLNGADLNAHPLLGGMPASAENVARCLFDRLAPGAWHHAALVKVIVHEAKGCSASYCSSNDSQSL